MSRGRGRRGIGRRSLAGLWLVGLLALGSVSAQEETRYVTDRLLLGLHAERGGSGSPLRNLESGTELVVLEESGSYARVRTPEGDTGWVKSAFLVGDPPARHALPVLQARHDEVTAELEAARTRAVEAEESLARARASAEVVTTGAAEAAAEVDALRRENEGYRSRLDAAGLRLSLSWALGAAGLCLILGFLGGLAWMDHRSRKRHGGFRIY